LPNMNMTVEEMTEFLHVLEIRIFDALTFLNKQG